MADTPQKPPQAAGTPRWVKVFGIITLIAALLVVVLVLTGRGGPHSPRRHISVGENVPAGGTGAHTGPSAGVTDTQP